MTSLVTEKFMQNEYLKGKLIGTGNKEFHEATSDMKWGTGVELSSKALLTGTWSGQDLLGQILEKVRADLTTNASKTPQQSQSPLFDKSNPEVQSQHDDLEPLSDEEETETDTNQSHILHGTAASISPRAKPLSPERDTDPRRIYHIHIRLPASTPLPPRLYLNTYQANP